MDFFCKEEHPTNWPDLPLELHLMIIELLTPKDRCKFKRCSKLCAKEVGMSKDFFHGLAIHDNSGDIRIEVVFDKKEKLKNKLCGYVMQFEEIQDNKFLKYLKFNAQLEEVWRVELSPRSKLTTVAFTHFKRCLASYQHGLKYLEIGNMITKWQSQRLGVYNFKKLEYLKIGKNSVSMFSKVKDNLKSLTIYDLDAGPELQKVLVNTRIFNISRNLIVPSLMLHLEDVLNLSARNFYVSFGNLNEDCLISFIERWQAGQLWEQFHSCRFQLNSASPFDMKKILHHFGCPSNTIYQSKNGIIPSKNGRKTGRVWIWENVDVGFTVDKES